MLNNIYLLFRNSWLAAIWRISNSGRKLRRTAPYFLHKPLYHQVCHGDIKLENVMVSSWNWLLLADFATIKPTLLPEDDPADFTYFFDTSRRRTCYIAPERLVLKITMFDISFFFNVKFQSWKEVLIQARPWMKYKNWMKEIENKRK